MNSFLHKPKEFVHSMSMRIVKCTGNMASRDISAELEEDLQSLYYWCRYAYITQRPLDLATATSHNMAVVHTWVQQLVSGRPRPCLGAKVLRW